jgi:hypothetical protein
MNELVGRLSEASIAVRRYRVYRPLAWLFNGFREPVLVSYPEGQGSDEVVALVEGAVRILQAMGVTSETGRWRWRAIQPSGG